MEQFNSDFDWYTSAFRLAQACSRINLDSILVDTLQQGVTNQLATMMTTAALPLGQEQTGWKWEQWLDKAGEFYRNVVQLWELRARDDNILPRSSPPKWTPFWKRKPTPDLEAMDINWVSLSPYERADYMRKNKCFTCHKQGCHPWKHSRPPWKMGEAEGSLWVTNFTDKNPSQSNSPIAPISPRAITIPVELYKTENGKIFETNALIDSRETISCINSHLVRRMKWPLKKLSRLMYTWNANETNNTGGMIQHWIMLHLWVQGRMNQEDFYILDLGGQDNIILGYPWLMKNNPQINWTIGEVHMIGTPIPRYDEPEILEQRYLIQYLGACQHMNLWYTTAICW